MAQVNTQGTRLPGGVDVTVKHHTQLNYLQTNLTDLDTTIPLLRRPNRITILILNDADRVTAPNVFPQTVGDGIPKEYWWIEEESLWKVKSDSTLNQQVDFYTNLPPSGQSDKIYVRMSDGTMWYWDGTRFQPLGSDLPEGTATGQVLTWDDTTKTWNASSVGGYVYPTGLVSNNVDPVGWVKSGYLYGGKAVEEVVEAMLKGYPEPTFSSFSLNGFTVIETGSSIPATKTFQFSTVNDENIKPGSTRIERCTSANCATSVIYIQNAANTSPRVITNTEVVTRTTVGTETFKITQDNTNNNPFSTTYSVQWIDKVYYGSLNKQELQNLTSGDIQSLSNQELDNNATRTWVFANPGELLRQYVCIPYSISEIKSFITNNGFAWAYYELNPVEVTNSFGVPTMYRVYGSVNAINTNYSVTSSINN